jgi:hypothetical protein
MWPPDGAAPTKLISCRSSTAFQVTVPFVAIVTAAGENVRSGVVMVAADGAAGGCGLAGGVGAVGTVAGGVAGGAAVGGVPVSGGFGSEIGAAPPPPHACRSAAPDTTAVVRRQRWRNRFIANLLL